jgi:hypothetical protein
VLNALAQSSVANNTIVIFTSDHGEYGGAHGLHGKAFAVYEESIRVPLYVMDPTGNFIPSDQVGAAAHRSGSGSTYGVESWHAFGVSSDLPCAGPCFSSCLDCLS